MTVETVTARLFQLSSNVVATMPEVELDSLFAAHFLLLLAGVPALYLLCLDQSSGIRVDALVRASPRGAVLGGAGRGRGGLLATLKTPGICDALRGFVSGRHLS